MSYLIKDNDLVATIERLAKRKHMSKIDVIREAVRREAKKVANRQGLRQRLEGFYAKTGVLESPRAIDWAEMKRHDDELSGI